MQILILHSTLKIPIIINKNNNKKINFQFNLNIITSINRYNVNTLEKNFLHARLFI